ncbi:hypothetical protein [Rhizobium alvei]|uniref:Uncharacterized protein n=1 Tax=Rhizobium alvei TaxID=1132659 RepID=A0ABT8YL86_9HYPH|nr:hypothetical protein [Rhizobium alvei]MDO6963985.1 hypothetical protein [Rhizobium alvei]
MPRFGAYHRSQATRADRVPFAGTDTRILSDFSEALHQEASRLGMSSVEYALLAASEKMQRAGRKLSGLFEIDDLSGEGI